MRDTKKERQEAAQEVVCHEKEVTGGGLRFRAGTMEDLPEIVALAGSAVAHMEAQKIYQWDARYPTEQDFAEDIRRGELTVGHLNGSIAVVYVLNQTCDEQYRNGKWKNPEMPYLVLHRLCVDPAYQNRGLAGRTMAHIEDVVREKGIGNIRLDVFSENPSALRLYDRCGFSRVGTTEWRMGRFYLMEKWV